MKQYIPSNGMEGEAFICGWCANCARDAICNGSKSAFDDCADEDLCSILAASFRGEAKEWVEHEDGSTECTAFVELGKPLPRSDDKTVDMFA